MNSRYDYICNSEDISHYDTEPFFQSYMVSPLVDALQNVYMVGWDYYKYFPKPPKCPESNN